MRLRVLTLNVWGLPAPAGHDVEERLSLVLRDLAPLACDVALFQEVWTETGRRQLVEGARGLGFPHAWADSRPATTRGAAGNGGGLVAVSRLPIRSARFRPYTLCGLPQRLLQMDYYAGKGLLRLDVEVGGTPVALFSTHLHARYAPAEVQDDYVGHRTGEVLELGREVRAVPGPVVAVGDFNMRDSAPEYEVLLGLTGFVDSAAALGAREPTSTLQNAYRLARGSLTESRIDYVFCRSGEQQGATPVAVRRVFDQPVTVAGETAAYSDHAGVLADVEIGGPGRPRPAIVPGTRAAAAELLREGRRQALARRRDERIGTGVAAAAALGAVRVARHDDLTRRGFLRASAWGGAGLFGLSGLGLVTLSESFVPDELQGYDAMDRLLAELTASEGHAPA